jgi:hypothetical protein
MMNQFRPLFLELYVEKLIPQFCSNEISKTIPLVLRNSKKFLHLSWENITKEDFIKNSILTVDLSELNSSFLSSRI